MGHVFDNPNAPVLGVAKAEVPTPYAANLEKLALIKVDDVVRAAKTVPPVKMTTLLVAASLVVCCFETSVPNVAKAETFDKLKSAYVTCLGSRIGEVDDGISDAKTVAKVVVTKCHKLRRSLVDAATAANLPANRALSRQQFMANELSDVTAFVLTHRVGNAH